MPEKKKEKNNPKRQQKPEPKSKPKQKPKVVSKAKPKEKQKSKVVPKVVPNPKAGENKVIVEIERQEPQRSEEMYNSKLKSLLNKIKSQNQYSDNGIRFAWRN
jgi:hypothetical protein